MSEQALREQLIAIIRTEFEAVRSAAREQHLKDSALTDEEWWDQRVTDARSIGGEWVLEHLNLQKEQLLARRHPAPSVADLDPEALATEKADELLTELIEVRSEREESGPVTEEQYWAASMLHSQRLSQQLSGMLSDKAEAEENPVRKQFLDLFASNVRQDLEDLKELSDLDAVTEEMLERVTSRIVGRLQRLNEGDETER